MDGEARARVLAEVREFLAEARALRSGAQTGAALFRQNEILLARLDRLAWVLGLDPQERSFVRALAREPWDAGTLLVFADWLEERQRPEGCALRRLVPEDGSVLVVKHPVGDAPWAMRQAADVACGDIARKIGRLGREVYYVLLPEGMDMECLGEEQMNELGWVRASSQTGQKGEG